MVRFLLFIGLLLITAFVGVVGYGILASAYAEAAVAGTLAEPFDTSAFGANEAVVRESGRFFHSKKSPSGAFIRVFSIREDGSYYNDLAGTCFEAVIAAIDGSSLWPQSPSIQPFFMVVLGTHLAIVWLFRVAVRPPLFGRRLSRSFFSHAAGALVWLVLAAWCTQLARLVWSSERWGAGAYLADSRVSPYGFAWLYGVFLLAYVSGLYMTGGPVRVFKDKNSCRECGYPTMEGACAECGTILGDPQQGRFGPKCLAMVMLLLGIFTAPFVATTIVSALIL